MKQSTERKTIFGSFVVAVSILAAIGVAAYLQIQDLIETNQWVAQTHEEIVNLQSVRAHLADAESGRRGYIISGQTRYLTLYQQAVGTVTRDLNALQYSIGVNPAQQRRLKSLRSVISEKLALLEQSVVLRQNGDSDTATKLFLAGRDDALTEDIRSTISMMITIERSLLSERNLKASASSSRTFVVLLLGSFIAYLLLTAVFYRLQHELMVRQKSEAELRQAREDLEQQVAARTSELAEANRVLEKRIAELTRAERMLRESQALFQTLASVSPVGIFRADADGNCIYANARLCQIAGLSVEQVLGDGWRNAVHPDDRDRVTTAWPEATYSFQRFEMEFRLRRAGGSVVWVLCQSVPERDEQGALLGHIGTVTDITSRVQTEESMQQSRQMLQATMDALSAHVAILDDHGMILAVNRPWRQFGERNQFRGKSHGVGMNYLHVCDHAEKHGDHDAGQVALGIRDVINGMRTEFRCEYPCHSPTETRWFQARVTRLERHRPVRLAVAHEDVTEVKRVEHSLRQLSGRLLRLQDEERRHIARELHDVTGQNLSAAALDLGRLQKLASTLDAKEKQLIEEALALTEQSLREVRTMSYLLHPPFLDEAGLVDALNWYVEGFTKRSGIRVDVVALPDLGRLPREAETALFRVVQESLTNIHRHSGSSTAAIQLRRDNGQVRLEVRDTGGVTVTAAREAERRQAALGVGITGMRERLRQLGGVLEIDFGRHGTTVKAMLPIEGNGT